MIRCVHCVHLEESMLFRPFLSLVYLLVYALAMAGLKTHIASGDAPTDIIFSAVGLTGAFILLAVFIAAALVRMDIVDTITTTSAIKKKP